MFPWFEICWFGLLVWMVLLPFFYTSAGGALSETKSPRMGLVFSCKDVLEVDIQLKSDQVEFQICTGNPKLVGLDLAFELLPTQGAIPSNFSLIRAAAIKEKKY